MEGAQHCCGVQDITVLMKAGMNVARFNFSHGEYDWFEESFELIRRWVLTLTLSASTS